MSGPKEDHKYYSFHHYISPTLIRDLNVVTGNEGNKAAHKALEAAIRPAKMALKQEFLQLRSVSEQSSGSTANAIVFKVKFPDKPRGTYGYAYAGVDKRYSEMIKRNSAERTAAYEARNKRSGVRKSRYIADVSIKKMGHVQTKGDKKRYSGFRKSHQTARLRLRKGKSYQHNIPYKYWHLLEYGFQHGGKEKTKFTGYHFVQQTHDKLGADIRYTFEYRYLTHLMRNKHKLARKEDPQGWDNTRSIVAGQVQSL